MHINDDDPLNQLALEFFANNWVECLEGLLTRTTRIRVWPEFSPAPRAFRFEIDCPYKRKLGPESPVEWMPGPVKGEVIYRRDLFSASEGPTILVLIDRDLAFFHPNYSRARGFLCIGEESQLPPGPIPLGRFLENHIYPIVTYQNRRPTHPADAEAARYFALEPTAMVGLEPVAPLY
ncbi:MAG: hypothetical protein U1A77_16195 [Pirellulales bacterium]